MIENALAVIALVFTVAGLCLAQRNRVLNEQIRANRKRLTDLDAQLAGEHK